MCQQPPSHPPSPAAGRDVDAGWTQGAVGEICVTPSTNDKPYPSRPQLLLRFFANAAQPLPTTPARFSRFWPLPSISHREVTCRLSHLAAAPLVPPAFAFGLCMSFQHPGSIFDLPNGSQWCLIMHGGGVEPRDCSAGQIRDRAWAACIHLHGNLVMNDIIHKSM